MMTRATEPGWDSDSDEIQPSTVGFLVQLTLQSYQQLHQQKGGASKPAYTDFKYLSNYGLGEKIGLHASKM